MYNKREGVEIPPEPTEDRKMELKALSRQYRESIGITHWASPNLSFPSGSLHPNVSQQSETESDTMGVARY